MSVHLIMPMGGAGTRFREGGYECPKPLISLCGKPFFQWACDSVRGRAALASLTFVVLQEHIDRFGIDERIREAYPEARVIALPKVLNGAVLTAMEGAKAIADGRPVLFCDCDLSFSCRRLYEMLEEDELEADGTLLTFASDLDRYSYVLCDENGLAVKTAEKQVISPHAITGAYGFRNAALFLDAAGRYLEECEYREYFMSGVYNVLIRDGRRIRVLEAEETLSFGTPEEYDVAAACLMSR